MLRHVDIYLPLDSRDEPNAEVWPIAKKQLTELIKVIEKCGWKTNVLNSEKPISSVAEGMKAIKKARGGILFIDEAYMLFKEGGGNERHNKKSSQCTGFLFH